MSFPCALLLSALSFSLIAENNGFTNEPTKAGSQKSIDEFVAITESLRTGLLAGTRTANDRYKMLVTGPSKIERIGTVEDQTESLVRYRLTFGNAVCVINVDILSGGTTPAADVRIVAASDCAGGEPRRP